ncbi:MAG: exodeoxyribonuclease VII small subunit [Pirellulaceae bacterium]
MAKKRKSTPTPDPQQDIDFETALAEVEEIVFQLESGDAGLTESLAHYETGIKRLKQCHQLLQKAERRITLLSGFDADGNAVTEPFDSDDESPSEAKRKSRSARSKVNGPKADGATNPRNKARKGTGPSYGDSFDSDDDPTSVDDLPGLF